MAWNTISEHRGGEALRAKALDFIPGLRADNQPPHASEGNKVFGVNLKSTVD